MKIVLIGFMAAGKSSVALLLSETLNLKLIETDQIIITRKGYSSIKELFSKLGEKRFRELESEMAKDLRDVENVVISPGGGMIINPINREFLRFNAKTVYLETSFEEIKRRLQKHIPESNTARPLFSNLEEAFKLYQERLPIYQNSCDFLVQTDGRAPQEVSDEIMQKIQGR